MRTKAITRLFGSIESRSGVNEPGYAPPLDDRSFDERMERSAATHDRYTGASNQIQPDHTAGDVPTETRVEAPPQTVNLAAALLVAIGGIAILVASVLPIYETAGTLAVFVNHLPRDTFVQQGEWLMPIAGVLLLLGALDAAVRRGRREGRRMLVVACLSAAVIGYAIYEAHQKVGHTHGLAALGIGVYISGIGAALALIGGYNASSS